MEKLKRCREPAPVTVKRRPGPTNLRRVIGPAGSCKESSVAIIHQRSVTGAPACLLADRARPAEPLPPSPPRPHPVRALARSGPSVSPGRAAKHLDRPMGRTRQAWYATTRRPACPDSISLAEPLVGGHTGRLHASDYPSPRGELQTEPDSTALARPGLSGL